MENKLIDDAIAIHKSRKYFFGSLVITILFIILGSPSSDIGYITLRLLITLNCLFALIAFVPLNRIAFVNDSVRFRQTRYRTGPLTIQLKDISYIKVELYLRKWNIINYYHITFFDTTGKQIATWGSNFWATDEYIDKLKQMFSAYGVVVKS